MCAVVFLGMAMHAVTMPYSPVHWIDDVMINEGARGGILHKDADWSMVWFPDEARNQKSWLINYFGSWVLEVGYQMFGHLGPRILTMGWLLVLTALVTLYFHRKLKGWGIPCLLGLIVFAFPGAVQSARGARVDVIALAFIFAALSALQFVGNRRWTNLAVFSLCGFFCAMAFFTWQPAGMLYPLVLWEVIEQFIGKKAKVREISILLLSAALAFSLTVVLMMYPFWDDFWHRLFGATGTVGKMAERSEGTGWHWREYFKALFNLPWVFCFGFAALFLRRRLWFLVVTVLGLSLLCIATKVYVFRMLYLMPYAIIGLGIVIASWRKNRLKHGLGIGLLCLMVMAAFGWSVALRNFTEYFTKDFRDYEKMRQTLDKEIGRDVRICLGVNPAYYIGRELGWSMYSCHDSCTERDRINLLREKVDFVLFDTQWEQPGDVERIMSYGFKTNYLICTDIKKPSNRIERFLVDHGRSSAYGPFRVFRK